MRTATLFTAGWLAPVALASAIPSLEETSPALSFDKRQDTTLNILNGKILQADLYAGIAGLNQQIYQATQKPDQWKKCNPLNIVVRREWYDITDTTSMTIIYSLLQGYL
jgi:tyrosinase